MTPELIAECRDYLDMLRDSDPRNLNRRALARLLFDVKALTQAEAESVVDTWAKENGVELK